MGKFVGSVEGERGEFVELRDGAEATEEEIIDWCRDKMTGFKRPKSVVFVDSLPLNPVGKVLRGVVKQEYGNP